MVNEKFQWIKYPEVESYILQILEEATSKNSFLKRLEEDLNTSTSTRLFDWLDYIAVEESSHLHEMVKKWEFTEVESTATYTVYHHFRAQFPKISLNKKSGLEIAVTVESIADFLMVRGVNREIEGTINSQFRRCHICTEKDVAIYVVERRASQTLMPKIESADFVMAYLQGLEKWKKRSRGQAHELQNLEEAILLAKELASQLGKSLAAWIVLQVERDYWQSKNSAAQIQKNRQDRLGMGWANHDHHTFRSSRQHFSKLVELFENLGFECRERFYAGEEAGWGAQVMENPHCRLVLFLDVDLDPEEIAIDFSHQPLKEQPTLGTIGLWCALHGDSILKAGMHHLEAQFEFESLQKDLKEKTIDMMEPFSNFPYLKQAFTVGELWKVDSERIDILLKEGKISDEEAKKFRTTGAVGSHLENLQRRDGYKGFNQKNVSFIIKKTDPRNL